MIQRPGEERSRVEEYSPWCSALTSSPCFSSASLQLWQRSQETFCPSCLLSQSKLGTTRGRDTQSQQNEQQQRKEIGQRKTISCPGSGCFGGRWEMEGDGTILERWTFPLGRGKGQRRNIPVARLCFCHCDGNCCVRFCVASIHCQQSHRGGFRG